MKFNDCEMSPAGWLLMKSDIDVEIRVLSDWKLVRNRNARTFVKGTFFHIKFIIISFFLSVLHASNCEALSYLFGCFDEEGR